jgi:hypothetical protein
VPWPGGALLSATALALSPCGSSGGGGPRRSSRRTVVDLAALERLRREEDLAFDRIVGGAAARRPAFADTADRLARQDDPGPAA